MADQDNFEDRAEDGREELPLLSGDFIERCFFILDEDGRDENMPAEEVMLYFYPEKGMDLTRKLFLVGSIVAMIKFVEHFTPEFPKTLALSRAKFSAKQVGDYTLVATGRPDEADGVLQNHIEALYSAYQFYYGPLPDVAKRFKNHKRADLIECINQQCRALLPLLHGFRKKGKLNAFLWLPFSSPPPNTSRHFMQASNILSSLQIQGGTYGGCVLFESSVLCTHVDVEITRWILNLVEFLKADKTNFARMKGADGSIFLPVYLTKQQLDKLSVEVNYSDADLQKLEQVVDQHYHYALQPQQDGAFLTLYVNFKGNTSLAILMNINNMDTLSVVKIKNSSMVGLETRLTSLEKDIQASYKKGKRTSAANLPREQSDGDLSHSTLFHYLTTDSLTGMTKGSVLSCVVGEKEERFLIGSSYVHEVYNNKQISKVMLGDHCGLLYSRHMFSKEIFYLRPLTSTNMADNVLEKLEDWAHRHLSENHNIQLI